MGEPFWEQLLIHLFINLKNGLNLQVLLECLHLVFQTTSSSCFSSIKQLLVSLSSQLSTEGVTKSPVSWGVIHSKKA